MTVTLLVLVALVACRPQANTPSHGRPNGNQPGDVLADVGDVAQLTDSAAIADYLRRRGHKVVRVADRRDEYYAVIAEEVRSGANRLFALQHRNTLVLGLGEPLDLGDVLPASVEWVSLQGLKTDALRVTFDNRLEGAIGTVVYALSSAGLRLTYRDGESSCAPAELRDLDGDRRPELISYVEDPSGSDCGDPCHLDIWQRFRAPPAWTQVQRWTGDRWEVASGNYPSFYRDVAERYLRMARWIADDPTGRRCRALQWMDGGVIFRAWASRANALASTH